MNVARLSAVVTTTTCLGVALTTLPAQRGPDEPSPGPGPRAAWTLAFAEDFTDSSLDMTKWNHRTDVKAGSAQRPENVTTADGVLSIALKQEEFAGKQYTGGGVVSKQSMRYGYYETRARINDGAGWHSSFWLMAGDGTTTYPPDARTEIDGFEIGSSAPTWLSHNLHTWKGHGVKADLHYSSGPYNTELDLRSWHTYGIDWSEEGVKYSIDGVLKYTAPYFPSQWTHDQVNIWLTSLAATGVPDATKLPSSVQFDYIRYWQRDYYVDNDGAAAGGYTETGSWGQSTASGWTTGTPTRVVCNTAGATASWRPNLPSEGRYEILVYRIVSANSDPAQRFDIDTGGTVSTRVLNGRTGMTGWVSLGTWSLPAGQDSAVTTTSSGSACARADAVKFVRHPGR